MDRTQRPSDRSPPGWRAGHACYLRRVERLFAQLRAASSPETWSKGVRLARHARLVIEARRPGSRGPSPGRGTNRPGHGSVARGGEHRAEGSAIEVGDTDEIELRVVDARGIASPIVTLAPGRRDGEVDCECDDFDGSCPHVAAALILWRHGKAPSLDAPRAAAADPPPSPRSPARSDPRPPAHDPRPTTRRAPPTTVPPAPRTPRPAPDRTPGATLAFALTRTRDGLRLDAHLEHRGTRRRVRERPERVLARLGPDGPRETTALKRLDAQWEGWRDGPIHRAWASRVLEALAEVGATLDGQPVRITAPAPIVRYVVDDDGSGFRLRAELDDAVAELFPNGIALRRTGGDPWLSAVAPAGVDRDAPPRPLTRESHQQ